MQARERMACAKKAPEHAMAIEIAGEKADAAVAERRPLIPIGARGGVELYAQPTVIGGDVGPRVCAAEEAEEALVVGQVLSRTNFEPAERYMRPVEVDRGDAGGISRQIREHVAPAGGNCNHLKPRADVERLHVDDRILPDLRIDQALERERKQALKHASARQRLRAMDRSLEARAGHTMYCVGRLSHVIFSYRRSVEAR